jgi:hypothetical protein
MSKNIKRCPKCGFKRNFGKGIRWCQVCEKEDRKLRDYYINKILEKNKTKKIDMGDSTIHRVENSEQLFKELNEENKPLDVFVQCDKKNTPTRVYPKEAMKEIKPVVIEDLPIDVAKKIVENNMAKITPLPIIEYKHI